MDLSHRHPDDASAPRGGATGACKPFCDSPCRTRVKADSHFAFPVAMSPSACFARSASSLCARVVQISALLLSLLFAPAHAQSLADTLPGQEAAPVSFSTKGAAQGPDYAFTSAIGGTAPVGCGVEQGNARERVHRDPARRRNRRTDHEQRPHCGNGNSVQFAPLPQPRRAAVEDDVP